MTLRSFTGLLPHQLRARFAFLESSSPQKRRLMGDGAWIVFGQIASAVGLIVGLRVLTEHVSTSIFGVVSLLLGLLSLGTNIFCAPLSQAALRFFPDVQQSGRVALLRGILRRWLWFSSFALVALILLGGGAYSMRGTLPLAAFAALAVLAVMEMNRSLEISFLTAARRQRSYALWGVADAWSKPAFAIAAVLLLGASAPVILAGYALSSALTLLLFMSCIDRDGLSIGQTPVVDTHLAAEIRTYMLPLLPLAIVGWFSSFSDRYIIGWILDESQVGIYAAIYALVSRPFQMAATSIGGTLRPVYFDAVSSGNKMLEQKTMRFWLGLTACICAMGILAVTLLRYHLADLLLATPYRSGADLMPWIALGAALLCFSQIYNTISLAYKKTRNVLISESAAAAGSILFGIPLIAAYGLRGAAWTIPLHFLLQLVVAWRLSSHCTQLPAAPASAAA